MNSKLIQATKQYYAARQQLNETLGLTNYKYELPENPQEKLYDFYFLALLGKPDSIRDLIFIIS